MAWPFSTKRTKDPVSTGPRNTQRRTDKTHTQGTQGFPDVAKHPPQTGDHEETVQELPTMVNIEDLRTGDIVIPAFGPTGSGKSTFIRSASGHTTHSIGHSLKSCTSEVVAIRFWDKESRRHVVLVDTPGFDSTFSSGNEVLGMISNWLNTSYQKNIRLSGIMYFHRITDNCMAGTPLRNLSVFRKLCGNDALQKVYLTTTMWDEIDQDLGERRFDELTRDYWKPMVDLGARTARCRNDDDSPRELVRRIVLHSLGDRKSLLIQKEMVKQKKSLDATSAGQQSPTQESTHLLQGHQEAEDSQMLDLENLNPSDIVIAVFGPTGSGKSTFITSASGRRTQEVSHSLKSFTNSVQAVKYWDEETKRYVVLVDTPGFDHTFRSDGDILNMISGWLKASYDRSKVLSGILYFHRITDNRMAASPLKSFRLLLQLCGKEALDKVYLTTTMWDEIDWDFGERRLDEFIAEYWKPMIRHGARVARCREDADLPKKLVQNIIFQELERKGLRLREEMVQIEKDLRGTTTGQRLYSQLEKLVERQSELLQRIGQERNPQTASSPGALSALCAEHTELLGQIDTVLGQIRELRLPWPRNLLRFLPRK